ncbi:hypothetical protein, partial [Streptomyces sp. NPDC059134]|uniref:hypothetical protein n=1 Tax=Streptomyces sp. NPDC059134 TaxID=3346738 RepID=UPI0036771FCA
AQYCRLTARPRCDPACTTGEYPQGSGHATPQYPRHPSRDQHGLSTPARSGPSCFFIRNGLAAGLAAAPDADLRHVHEGAIDAIVREHGLVAGTSPTDTVSVVRQHDLDGAAGVQCASFIPEGPPRPNAVRVNEDGQLEHFDGEVWAACVDLPDDDPWPLGVVLRGGAP